LNNNKSEQQNTANRDKYADEAFCQSEERYKSILDNIPEAFFEVDFLGNFIFFNSSLCKITGYSREELSRANYKQFSDEENSKKVFQIFDKVYKTGEPEEEFDWLIIRKDGRKRYIEASVSLNRDSSGHVSGFKGIIRDITDRRLAEEAIKNSEAKYRDIFKNAMEGIYQSTIEGKFITANAAFVRMAGYDSPEELIESIKDIRTQFYANPVDREVFLEIMRTKGFVNGFEVEFRKKDGSTIWVILNVRAVKDKNGEIRYIEGFMQDISFRKQAEKKLYQTLESLKKATNTTIQVLVSSLEAKDHYTVDHQSRTTDLACAIAGEMRLPQERIEGIRMAGTIHDIGKISLPTEILTKPGKLTNLEFSLIKEHSHTGYEILKDVESPWPLAEIIYQHHERMNGSIVIPDALRPYMRGLERIVP